MSDEEFLRIGQEFDLDAFIRGLNPPTVDEIIESLEPIPTLEECLAPLPDDPDLPFRRTLTRASQARAQALDAQIQELAHEGRFVDELPLAEELSDIIRRDLGNDHWRTLDNACGLAMLRRFSALPAPLQAEFSLAVSLHNLAAQLSEEGNDAQAKSLYRAELALLLKHLGEADLIIAATMVDFATALRALGEYAEAEPLYCAAVAMFRKSFGDAHPDVPRTLNKLASLLQAEGDYASAEHLYRGAVLLLRKLLGDEDPWVAESMSELASFLLIQGDYGAAEPLLRHVLALRRRLPGDFDAEVATSLNDLAVLLHLKGDYVDAEQLYRDALDIVRRLHPGDHPCVATGLNNLAGVLQDRGALAEAERRYRDALAMDQRLYPSDHPNVATGLNNLASVLQDRGALVEAERRYRDSLAMYQRFYAGDHPDVAISLNNLATFLRNRGALAEAERLLRGSLAMSQRLFPGDHRRVASSLNNLGFLLTARGALDEAEPLYRNAFDMSERLRTQIIGGEKERATFAARLDLSGRAHAYAGVLAQLHREDEVLGILERGRARAALDLLERSGRDLVAEAAALGDAQRSHRLAAAQAAEERTRIDLTSTEALLTGRRSQREVLEEREDLDVEIKARQLAEYDQEIAALLDDVKRRRRALTQAGSTVLTELRGLFPIAQALTTEEILDGLAAEEAVVSFAWSSKSVLVGTAADGKTGAVIVANDKDAVKRLGELARRVRTVIANRPSSGSNLDRATTRELARTLLPESVCSAVAGARRLIVLPDGPLNDIPLQILVEAEPALVDKSVVYAPSATIYLHQKATRQQRDEATRAGQPLALLLGDPIFDRGRQEPDYPQEGVLIAAAVQGGNAAKAGLKRGDVLLRYDGRTLDQQTPLPKVMGAVDEAVQKGERAADEAVKVTYWRDGQDTEIELPPGKLGVRIQPGKPADGLRSMALFERGFDAAAAQANSFDQVRLFGGSLPRLPGTRFEAEAIAVLFQRTLAGTGWPGPVDSSGGAAVRLLLGEQATVANLTEQVRNVRYLHLATHGLMGSAERPYDASLALTQPKEPTPDDIGFLRLQDLMSYWGGRLNKCEQVVLSACDTQRGVRQGDTMMSLPLGFFFAGTPTVVASLWKVDDVATTLLMTRFYQNLLGQYAESRGKYESGSPMPKAEALREAKRWLRRSPRNEIKAALEELKIPASGIRAKLDTSGGPRPPGDPYDFSHPYYWAAFILIGDPD